MRGKRNALSICGSPPGSGAVSPPIRAIRAFGRQGGQYRSATEAGLAATNPARSMSGARLTPSVPLQRLVAASLVGREA
jgi:hypothetical protein